MKTQLTKGLAMAWALLFGGAPGLPAQTRLFLFEEGPTRYNLITYCTHFGKSLAGPGDLNGDGTPDILVGAHRSGDSANPLSGVVSVFSGKDGRILRRFRGTYPPTSYGYAVSSAGDVDKDGTPDILIGAPDGRANGTMSGSAFVYSGKTGSLIHTFHGKLQEAFGNSVSGAGDGDGYADVVIGTTQGHARVFSGKTGKLLHELKGNPSKDFGALVAGLGDVDRDGFGDTRFPKAETPRRGPAPEPPMSSPARPGRRSTPSTADVRTSGLENMWPPPATWISTGMPTSWSRPDGTP